MLRQYRAYVVDLLGLGIHVWCVLLCVQPIPILSAFFLCHHFLIFHLLVPSLFMFSNDSLCCRFVCMCVSDSIVCKCVSVNDCVIGKFITRSYVLCYDSAVHFMGIRF